MGRYRNDDRAVQPQVVGDAGRQRPKRRARRNDLREDRRRNVEPLQEIGRPAFGGRVVALGRSRVRELGRLAAAEPEMEQVRDQQQPSGRLEGAIMLGRHCCELEDRVDREQLDAGALIELARGNPVEQQ